jgi:hypothetical protein
MSDILQTASPSFSCLPTATVVCTVPALEVYFLPKISVGLLEILFDVLSEVDELVSVV